MPGKPGVLVQQPVTRQRHLVESQRRRVARLQAHQLQVIGACQALGLGRNGHHERRTAGFVFDGRRHHETALAQVGHPVQTPFQVPPISYRPATHLQRFDAGQELHGVGQPGGTRQFARQQARQQALAQWLVGAV